MAFCNARKFNHFKDEKQVSIQLILKETKA